MKLIGTKRSTFAPKPPNNLHWLISYEGHRKSKHSKNIVLMLYTKIRKTNILNHDLGKTES